MDLIDPLLPAFDRLGADPERPVVTLSYAQTLDGSLAWRSGRPLTISGPEALRITHRLRAAHEAILVGIGTVLADDPRLTARFGSGPDPQPVILDSRLRFPENARLLENPRKPWILTCPDPDPERRAALEENGARVFPLPAGPSGGVDLRLSLHALGRLGIRSVMVEGGARVIPAFLRPDSDCRPLADQAVITVAPLLGGGLRLAGNTGEYLLSIADPRLTPAGKDWIISGLLEPCRIQGDEP